MIREEELGKYGYYEPFEGVLSKKGDGKLKAWRTRFFSLNNNHLSYYTPDSKRLLKGQIDLNDPSLSISLHSPSSNYFSISTNNNKRCFYLWSSDSSEADKWVKMIRFSILLHSNKRNHQVHSDGSVSPFSSFSADGLQSDFSCNNNSSSGGRNVGSGGGDVGDNNKGASYVSVADAAAFAVSSSSSVPSAPPMGSCERRNFHCSRIDSRISLFPLKLWIFSEGEAYSRRLSSFDDWCSVIYQSSLDGFSTTNVDLNVHKGIVCLYMGLRMLHWENSLNHILSEGSFSNAIFSWMRTLGDCTDFARRHLLGMWPDSAPTCLTLIDTFVFNKITTFNPDERTKRRRDDLQQRHKDQSEELAKIMSEDVDEHHHHFGYSHLEQQQLHELQQLHLEEAHQQEQRRSRLQSNWFFLQGDLESVLIWNLAILHRVVTRYGLSKINTSSSPLNHHFSDESQSLIDLLASLDQLMEQLYTSLQHVPSEKYASLVISEGFGAATPDHLPQLFRGSFTFQKLKAENQSSPGTVPKMTSPTPQPKKEDVDQDNNNQPVVEEHHRGDLLPEVSVLRGDSYLSKKLETASHEFSVAKREKTPEAAPYSALLRSAEMKYFMAWCSVGLKASLLYTPIREPSEHVPSTCQLWDQDLDLKRRILLMKNSRILKRIAAPLDAFPPLQNSLFILSIAFEEKIPQTILHPPPPTDDFHSLLRNVASSMSL